MLANLGPPAPIEGQHVGHDRARAPRARAGAVPVAAGRVPRGPGRALLARGRESNRGGGAPQTVPPQPNFRMTAAQIQLPARLQPIFAGEAQFRGAYGGRGSAKSRSFATMAAVKGMMCAQAGESGLIVCAREFQNSLADSSMAEVKAAIESHP